MSQQDQSRWVVETVDRIVSLADDETVTVAERSDNLDDIEAALDAARSHLEMRRDEGAE